MILQYEEINKLGHFNIIHLNLNIDIMQNLKDIPILLDNKYNYHILKKINQHHFEYIINNKNLNNSISNNNNYFIENKKSNINLTNHIKKFVIKSNENFEIISSNKIRNSINISSN